VIYLILLVLTAALLVLALSHRRLVQRLNTLFDLLEEGEQTTKTGWVRYQDLNDELFYTYQGQAQAKIADLETQLHNAHMSLLMVLDSQEENTCSKELSSSLSGRAPVSSSA
jgi:hypothetical protein